MKFGPVPVAEAEGAIAVHSIRQAGLVGVSGASGDMRESPAREAADPA